MAGSEGKVAIPPYLIRYECRPLLNLPVSRTNRSGRAPEDRSNTDGESRAGPVLPDVAVAVAPQQEEQEVLKGRHSPEAAQPAACSRQKGGAPSGWSTVMGAGTKKKMGFATEDTSPLASWGETGPELQANCSSSQLQEVFPTPHPAIAPQVCYSHTQSRVPA